MNELCYIALENGPSGGSLTMLGERAVPKTSDYDL